VTLSPYALTDTFGVAKVGELSGVKLDTPSGPVWTDPWGRAVVAQMNPFQNTRVEVQTKTLPRNIDIKNGLQNLSLGRGAVGKLDFPVETSRRVLLQAVDSQSEPVRKGAAVLDAKGQYVTSVVDGGQVFLSNEQLTQALSISFDGGKTCQLHYQLAAEADLNVYFETAKATCTER
jgi:outer membrane usher protein FimD/PapC